MSLPAVHVIRRALPETTVELLIQESLQPLLEGYTDVDRLHTIPAEDPVTWKTILRTARRLHHLHPDAIVIFNPTKLFHIASFLAGIPIRVGYRRKFGFLLTHSLPDTKSIRDLHDAEYNLELIRLLGIPTNEPPTLTLPTHPREQMQLLTLLEGLGISTRGPLVALHPWTSNPAKSWPLESFWSVADNLIQKGQPVALIGEPTAEERRIPAPGGVADLRGRIPLGLLPEFLRLCTVLLSNDSGPAHVAAAVGTPVVVVAPKEHERQLQRWRPIGESHRILIAPTISQVSSEIRSILDSG